MASFWFDPLPLVYRPCQKLQSKCFSVARTSHHCWACNNYFQILPYVNGTLYSLLSHGRFALAAKDLGIEQKLIEVTQKLDGDGETRSTAVLYWCHDTVSSGVHISWQDSHVVANWQSTNEFIVKLPAHNLTIARACSGILTWHKLRPCLLVVLSIRIAAGNEGLRWAFPDSSNYEDAQLRRLQIEERFCHL